MQVNLSEIATAYIVTPYGCSYSDYIEFTAGDLKYIGDNSGQLLVQTRDTAKGCAGSFIGRKLSVMSKVTPVFSFTLTSCYIPDVFPGHFHARQISTSGPEISAFDD